MSLKWLFPIGGALGILIMISYVTSANTTPQLSVPTVTPISVPFVKYVGGSGITEPNTEIISIGTNKAGVVKHLFVKPGDEVKAGDTLFTIENSEAIANANQMMAELKKAQDSYNIIMALKDKNAVSLEERNQKLNELNSAKARYKQAEANLNLHSVKSPVEGTVLSSNIRIGEFASAGNLSEPLLRIGNISPMYIRVDIDENDAWRFNKKSKAAAYVRGNNKIKVELDFVRLEPYIRPKRSLTGDSVERVDTRVLQIVYKFDPKNQPIYVGQQMDVYIEE